MSDAAVSDLILADVRVFVKARVRPLGGFANDIDTYLKSMSNGGAMVDVLESDEYDTITNCLHLSTSEPETEDLLYADNATSTSCNLPTGRSSNETDRSTLFPVRREVAVRLDRFRPAHVRCVHCSISGS